jgi:pSer/pThr/pTyr-binding forkhead associated (FHA) protein
VNLATPRVIRRGPTLGRLDELPCSAGLLADSVAAMPFLILRSGARSGERIEVVDELVVGREHADVTVYDEEVSRRHLAVRPHDDGVELEDLGSTNGTFVDGARLSAAVVITESARVMIGETEIEIEVEVPEPEVDPSLTRVRERPQLPDATVVRSMPVAPPAAPAPAAARAVAAAQPFGAFTPAAPARQRSGPATRLWAPATVVFVIIVATAVALVIYFAAR